jgi:hypothetical protein
VERIKQTQLRVICEVLGAPTKAQREAIAREDPSALELLHSAIRTGSVEDPAELPEIPTVPLEQRMPFANAVQLDLLRQLLRFLPSERPTALQALRHAFFDGVRREEDLSDLPSPGSACVVLEETSAGNIRQLLVKQILHFNPTLPEPTWDVGRGDF